MAGLASVGLIVALVVNPDVADRTASVTGAVVGLAAFALSVVTLGRDSGSGVRRRVRSGQGGIAAAGDVIGNAVGDRSKVIGAPTTPGSNRAAEQPADVRAGRDGIAAAGDVRDNALGEGSERR
ncbi:hypothetical protein [Streptomyces cinerochromogenes]|uniref:hypothetical protein n=1 Tax=Streptomyces cinerochromogenes TaxID=66422 RepID=UPI0033A94E4D